MKYLNNDDFETAIKEKCYIQFSAEWCGPCKTLSRYIEEVEENYNEIKFYKINIDKCDQQLLSDLGITSVPRSVFFSSGECITTVIGYQQKLITEALDHLETSN